MKRHRYSNRDIYFDYGRLVNSAYYIKCAIYPFVDWAYNLLYILIPRQRRRDAKYNVSICAIFRNETSSLKEWIEYHKLLGVDHFYMYNNFSTDNYKEILNPYIESGDVTLIEFPVQAGQFKAYMDWYENYRHETQWVSFLDLDEFIVPTRESNIPDWLAPMSKYPVIKMYWLMFTSSGKMNHDPSVPNIEQHVVCADKLTDIGKIFYNTSFELYKPDVNIMHGVRTRYKGITLYPVNEWGHITWRFLSRFRSRRHSVIQVNHYWGRALDQFLIKKERGDALQLDVGIKKDFATYFKFEQYSFTADYRIFRYLIPLKLRLKGIKDL